MSYFLNINMSRGGKTADSTGQSVSSC